MGDRPADAGTVNMFFRAWSLPLRIASGTSLALPRPTPALSAAVADHHQGREGERQPPLTTLATRLMWTTRSFLLGARGSR